MGLLIALLALGLAWSTPASAGEEGGQPIDPTSALTGSLTGAVQAFGTDSPVSGVVVEAFGAGDTTTPTASATTGPSGTFTFPTLPPGSYALRYVDGNVAGYAPQWLRSDGAGTTRAGALTIATLGDGSTVTAPTMTLVDTDPSHVDLGVSIGIAPQVDVGSEVQAIAVPIQPRWTVDGTRSPLADDDEMVITTDPTVTISSAWAHGEEAGECRVETPQRAVCERPGLEVYLGLVPSVIGPFTVNAAYSSSLTEATPQGYANTASATSNAVVRSTRLGFVLHDERHAPIALAQVWAYRDGDSWLPSAPQAYEATDALGNVLFEDLPPGDYRLLVQPASSTGLPTQWLGGATRGSAWSIRLTPGFDLVTDLDLFPHVVIPRTISGVVDAGGAPVQGVTVRAFASGSAWVAAVTTTTAADGSYSFDGLAPDRYSLRFDPPAGSGRAAVWYGGTAGRAGSAVVDAATTPNPRTDIDQALPERGIVEGAITSVSGPVAGVRIVFFAPGDTFGGSHEVSTGPDGRYTTPALPAGTYTIRIVPPAGSGLSAEWFDDTPDRALAAPVVAGASSVDVSAVLAP